MNVGYWMQCLFHLIVIVSIFNVDVYEREIVWYPRILIFKNALIQMMLWLFYYSPIRNFDHDQPHLKVESDHPFFIELIEMSKKSSYSHQGSKIFYVLIILLIFGTEVYFDKFGEVNIARILMFSIKF